MSTMVRIGKGLVWACVMLCALSLICLVVLGAAGLSATVTLIACYGLGSSFIGLFVGGAVLAFTPDKRYIENTRADWHDHGHAE